MAEKIKWNRSTLLRKARERMEFFPSERLGQALYNFAFSQNPAIAHLAGTEQDPFYDDAKIDAFLEKIDAR